MVQLYHGNVEMQDGLSLMPILVHPHSVGTVRLRSMNANDSPVIDPKLLTEVEDVNALVGGKSYELLLWNKSSQCITTY